MKYNRILKTIKHTLINLKLKSNMKYTTILFSIILFTSCTTQKHQNKTPNSSKKTNLFGGKGGDGGKGESGKDGEPGKDGKNGGLNIKIN